MRKKTKLLFCIITVLLSFEMIGCDNSRKIKESDVSISQAKEFSSSDIQGVWIRSNNVDKMNFYGDGTYQFYSTGMYSESGTYTISSDGTLVMAANSGTTKTMEYLTIEEMKNGANGSFWCLDGNKIYLDSATDCFTKQ